MPGDTHVPSPSDSNELILTLEDTDFGDAGKSLDAQFSEALIQKGVMPSSWFLDKAVRKRRTEQLRKAAFKQNVCECLGFAILAMIGMLLAFGDISVPVGDVWHAGNFAVIFSAISCLVILYYVAGFLASDDKLPPTWCGVLCSLMVLIFCAIVGVFCVIYVANAGYYEDQNCYKCHECLSTDTSLCWLSAPIKDHFDFEQRSYTDTCQCAMKKEFQQSLTIGADAEYCRNCTSCEEVVTRFNNICNDVDRTISLAEHALDYNIIDKDGCVDDIGTYDCIYYDPLKSAYFKIGIAAGLTCGFIIMCITARCCCTVCTAMNIRRDLVAEYQRRLNEKGFSKHGGVTESGNGNKKRKRRRKKENVEGEADVRRGGGNIEMEGRESHFAI